AVLAPHGETEPRAALEPRVLGGEPAGGHGHAADAREPAHSIGVEEGHELVVVDLGGKTARAIGNGKGLEGRDGLRGSLEGGGHRGGAAAPGGAHRAQAGDHDPAAGAHRPNTRLTFCPPKPKELDTAAPSSTDRAVPGTQSKGTSGSGSRRLTVGGVRPCCRESSVAAASMLPAAAMVWPISDLVELTSTRPSPKTRTRASASTRSFCGVPVPWALT